MILARSLVVFVALLIAFPAGAAPCERAVAVENPCSGLLIPESDARDALSCVRADLPAALKEIELTRAELTAKMERIKALAEAEADARRQLEDVIRDLSDQPPPSVLESPVLWGVVGLCVGAVAASLIAIYVQK